MWESPLHCSHRMGSFIWEDVVFLSTPNLFMIFKMSKPVQEAAGNQCCRKKQKQDVLTTPCNDQQLCNSILDKLNGLQGQRTLPSFKCDVTCGWTIVPRANWLKTSQTTIGGTVNAIQMHDSPKALPKCKHASLGGGQLHPKLRTIHSLDSRYNKNAPFPTYCLDLSSLSSSQY